MQQMLGVTQQEDIRIVINIFNLLLYTAEKTEVIKMTKCQVSRLKQFPLLLPFLLRIAKHRNQHLVGKHIQLFGTRMVFLIPVLREPSIALAAVVLRMELSNCPFLIFIK